MKKMRSTTKKPHFLLSVSIFHFCLSIRLCRLFSLFCLFARPMFLLASILFLSVYPPSLSFISPLSFRQANVSIHFYFISIFLSTFVIVSLSFVFSPGHCLYSLLFYFCLSIRLCHHFSLLCLFASPMFLFTPFFISVFLSTFVIFSLSFFFLPGQCFYSLQFYFCLSKTRMEQGGKQRCKIYISLTINFRHFKQLESHGLLST